MFNSSSAAPLSNEALIEEAGRFGSFEQTQSETIATPATWYRGGTSKALFVLRDDLSKEARDDLSSWIRAAFGSPHRLQIDGIGGADLVTSKFALIGPSTHPDADVDYSFYQVGIDSAIVTNDLNCGNISAAVAPFAIEKGIVAPVDGEQTVTIHNTNDGTLFYVTLLVKNGAPEVSGAFSCEGVPGTGSPIRLDFRATAGGRTGKLLPTGNIVDVFDVPGIGSVEATIVDVANLIVYARAESFGLVGNEDPVKIQANTALMDAVEYLRGSVAKKLGLVSEVSEAVFKSPALPFVALVSKAQDWVTFDERKTRLAGECDFTARGFTMQLAHKAYWGTGSVCTGVAAALPGSIVNQVANPESVANSKFRIGHPAGTVEVDIQLDRNESDSTFVVRKAQLLRTARKLMEGSVFVSRSSL